MTRRRPGRRLLPCMGTLDQTQHPHAPCAAVQRGGMVIVAGAVLGVVASAW